MVTHGIGRHPLPHQTPGTKQTIPLPRQTPGTKQTIPLPHQTPGTKQTIPINGIQTNMNHTQKPQTHIHRQTGGIRPHTETMMP